MIVKICGITNPEDLEVAVEAGANALGFNFFPRSPRYVTPERAAALARQVPAGVLKVGVFVNEPAERIAKIAAQAALDVAQLHGECGAPAGLRIWRAVAVGPGFDPASLAGGDAEALLLDAPAGELYGGTGRTFDWSRAEGLGVKFVLAGGLGPDNVAEAVRRLRPWGVDACSRLEAAPGRKDPEKVRAFVRAALGAIE